MYVSASHLMFRPLTDGLDALQLGWSSYNVFGASTTRIDASALTSTLQHPLPPYPSPIARFKVPAPHHRASSLAPPSLGLPHLLKSTGTCRSSTTANSPTSTRSNIASISSLRRSPPNPPRGPLRRHPPSLPPPPLPKCLNEKMHTRSRRKLAPIPTRSSRLNLACNRRSRMTRPSHLRWACVPRLASARALPRGRV
jgi:hypothetical protein